MRPIPSVFERAVRRSRSRTRVLLMLSSLGEAYAGQLSRHTGIRNDRVKGILVGKPPEYRVDYALVPLGLARAVTSRHGTFYEITTPGRRKARSITSALARRDVKRAFLRADWPGEEK